MCGSKEFLSPLLSLFSYVTLAFIYLSWDSSGIGPVAASLGSGIQGLLPEALILSQISYVVSSKSPAT